MRAIINLIPNTLTCCNLLCGCGAIIAAMNGDTTMAFWLIVTAAVFDFFDGFAARMLKAYSPIGGDLDSLADVVSFGVAPAFIWFGMGNGYWAYGAFLLAAFAALRLAKFNVDTRQTEEFRGLPTPAMALFIASTAITFTELNIWIWGAIIVAFSGIMVCDLPMFSFKFKSFGFKANSLRYFFAAFAVLAVMLLGYTAPAVIITVYIVVSLIRLLPAKCDLIE